MIVFVCMLLQEATVWVCLSSQLICPNQLAYTELFFEIVTVYMYHHLLFGFYILVALLV